MKIIRYCGLIVALASLLLCAATAFGYTFDLVYEFDGELPVQSYGTVQVVEAGGDLDFTIEVYTSLLGNSIVIDEFYFNLDGTFTNLSVSTAAYELYPTTNKKVTVAGGAGASFDYEVIFEYKDNVDTDSVSFKLSASEDLRVSDLFEFSDPNNTSDVNVAVHIQKTDTEEWSEIDKTSETIGGAVPIPAAAWLLGSGLVGLVVIRRRKNKNRFKN